MEGARSQGPSLGRYHLAEALGGGPTGEVFRAKVYGVAGFERLFAVKRFYRALSDDAERMKLLSEAARRYQTIEHPRIARMHEFGVIDGQAFVAVELIPGVDLARFVAFTHGLGASPPPGAVLGMVAQLARAIAYAQGRGVLHLGISPTNVVATPDGDVKVMDFGFLRARLPQRPAADATLAARLPYLAPEQIVGGATTPATDVFQLASLAQELLTGRRAFTGASAEETAQRVLAGRPQSETLPAGVGEVLERAFQARPEERYGTAGAFADALDNAIRRTPQTGGRSDVGAAVRRAQQRSSEMEAQQFSGAVAFPMPAPPSEVAPRAPLLGSSETPPPEPVPRSGESEPTRLGESPGSFTVGAPPRSGFGRMGSGGGLPRHPSEVGIGSSPASLPLQPPDFTGPAPLLEPSGNLGANGQVNGFAGGSALGRNALGPDAGTRPADDFSQTGTMERPASSGPVSSDGMPSVPHLSPMLDDEDALDSEQTDVRERNEPTVTAPGPGESTTTVPLSAPAVPLPAPLPLPPTPRLPPSGGPSLDILTSADDALPTTRRGMSANARGWIVFAAIALLGVGGYFAYRQFVAGKTGAKTEAKATLVADAGAAVAIVAPAPADAAVAAVAVAAADAGAAGVPAKKPPPPDAVLRFESDPPGADVYLDGALKGKTPFEMPGSADRHKLAMVMPGHALYRAEIDGAGVISAPLPAVHAGAGEGKIKVRCRTRNRLYVIVDGAPTGELCPTERIQTKIGDITVETYDPVTDTTRTHKVTVKKKTGGSLRVHLED
jgi:serine/threonine protein kinase